MFTRDEALDRVERAGSATDLFGPFDPARRKEAQQLYRRLAAVLHPDRVDAGDTRAHAASAELTRLHHEWQHAEPVELHTAGAVYRLTDRHAVGSVANVYRTDGPRVVKVARDPALNPLLHAEWDALRRLTRFTAQHRWLRPFYPHLVDTSGDVSRGDRAFTVLEPLVDGFVTLADVRRAFPDGLDGRDYAWMHRRLLRAIAGAHRIRLVHGAIVADNVLVHPQKHGIVLAGWSFAVTAGERLLATSKAITYPPEVHDGHPVTTATDVHMAHTLMLDLLAHDETRQRRFARWCTQDAPDRRPDAVDLLSEYDDLLDDLYGERTFRPFALPTGA
ncbi:adenylate cyclase [Saccharothrix sp. ALI-22-I]|uniref:protein kinase family protein n=1 Tax=Saccharothrix sp. ALI-22-I TaxID=1933778 RepID=UPI00097C00EB|nr:protein kinase family protein [Saccharothrix sp. ALI-22-I]ONI90035.1 adenylate cyclase [Saccharothrix sp. ALI-22-I]